MSENFSSKDTLKKMVGPVLSLLTAASVNFALMQPAKPAEVLAVQTSKAEGYSGDIMSLSGLNIGKILGAGPDTTLILTSVHYSGSVVKGVFDNQNLNPNVPAEKQQYNQNPELHTLNLKPYGIDMTLVYSGDKQKILKLLDKIPYISYEQISNALNSGKTIPMTLFTNKNQTPRKDEDFSDGLFINEEQKFPVEIVATPESVNWTALRLSNKVSDSTVFDAISKSVFIYIADQTNVRNFTNQPGTSGSVIVGKLNGQTVFGTNVAQLDNQYSRESVQQFFLDNPRMLAEIKRLYPDRDPVEVVKNGGINAIAIMTGDINDKFKNELGR